MRFWPTESELLAELLLRRLDGLVGEMGDQPVGDGPRLGVGLAHDEMDAQPELHLASLGGGAATHVLDLLGRLLQRLAPGEIDVALRGGEIVRRRGGAAEPDGDLVLHRREQHPRAFDLHMIAGIVDGLAGQQPVEHMQELGGLRVARIMVEKYALARQFLGVAAGDEVDEEAPVADAVERRGLAREMRRRRQSRAQRDQETQSLRQRGQRRGDDPGVFAMRADGDQRAAEAEPVGGLSDLLEIGEIRGAVAFVGPEIGAVAADRDEPIEIEGFV